MRKVKINLIISILFLFNLCINLNSVDDQRKVEGGLSKEFVSPNPEVYPDGVQGPEYDNDVVPLEGFDQPSYNMSQLLHTEEFQLINSITDGQAEKILVIPIEFSDIQFTAEHDQAYFQGIMDQMKAYYEFNSGYVAGSAGITLDVNVVAPVVSVRAMAYYGADFNGGIDNANVNIYELTREAVKLLDARGFNFAPYDTDHDEVIDHIMLIHAGDGQESSGSSNTIWSHRWAISGGEAVDAVYAYTYTMLPETGRLGVFAHEFGHDLGLPDLYDTDGNNNGHSDGAGKWDIMGSGSWNGSPAGSSPSNLSAWSRIQLGWTTPSVIGSNTMGAALTNNSGLSSILRLNPNGNPTPNEYFLIEYRRKLGYDLGLPGEGLMIWHIDQGVVDTYYNANDVNSNSSRLGVYPEQADGLNELITVGLRGDAGDPFPGSTENHNFAFLPFGLNASNIITTNSTYVDVLDIQTAGNTATADIYVLNQSPAKAELISPTSNSVVPRQPVFSWNIVPQTTSYVLQISTDSTFSTLDSEITLDSISDGLSIDANGVCSYTLNIDNQLDTTSLYFARVLAQNASSTLMNKLWSDSVIISNSSLAAPTGFTTSTITPGSISLTWNAVASATHYYLDVDGQTLDMGTNTSYAHSNLGYLSTHHYRVRATTATASSFWTSAVDASTIDIVMTIDSSAVVEGAEDGKILVIDFNEKFLASATNASLVRVNGLPSGVTQGTIARSNGDKRLSITLNGNSTVDYDVNATIVVLLATETMAVTMPAEVSLTSQLIATIEPQLNPPTDISFSFDGISANRLMGATTAMQISLDGGSNYSDINVNNMTLSAGQLSSITADNNLKVRNKATLRNPASVALLIDLEAQTTPAINRDDSANTLSGMVNAVELSINGGANWTKYVDASSLPDLTQDITFLVRSFAYENKCSGNLITLGFTSAIPAITVDATLDAPSVEGSETGRFITLNISSEIGNYIDGLVLSDIDITGLPQGVTKNSLAVINNKSISINFVGNSTVDYDVNKVITITIPKSKISPQPSSAIVKTVEFSATVELQLETPVGISFSFDGVNANKLIGTDNSMQASLNGGVNYFDLTADHVLSSEQVQSVSPVNNILIKRKATLREPESPALTIDILTQSSPAVSRNDDANTISGLVNGMVYSTNGTSNWQVYSGSLPDLTQTITLWVRYPAQGIYAASSAVVLSFTPTAPVVEVPPPGGDFDAPPPILPIIPGLEEEVPITETQGTQVTAGLLKTTNDLGQFEIVVPNDKADEPVIFQPAILQQMREENKAAVISQESISLTFPARAISDELLKEAGTGARLNLEMGNLKDSEIESQTGLFAVAGLVFEFKAQLVTDQKSTEVTEFKEDLSITISLEGADLSKLDREKLGVFWYNSSTKIWEYMGGTYDAINNTITFTTNHFSVYSIFENKKTFGDILSHWAKEDIEVMASKYIVKGKSETVFDPEATITKAEFTALVIRALKLTDRDLVFDNFKVLQDVTQDKWYYQEINLANNLGLLPVETTITFNPEQPITRETMAVIMAKGLSLKKGVVFDSLDGKADLLNKFTDIKSLKTEALDAVLFAVDEGLIKGRTANNFVPQGNLTRAEAAAVIRRMLKNIEANQ